MITVSDRWTDGIASDHRLVVEVVVPGTSDLLPVAAGSVTLDITAAARGRCELTFDDLDLIPTGPDSILAPYGQELQVKRGLIYPDGEREVVSLGIFRIEEVTVQDAADGMQIQVSGLDRSQRVSDASFETQYNWSAGYNFQQMVRDLIQEAYVDWDLSFSFDTNNTVCPTMTANEGDDRWVFCQTIANVLGMDLYFDNEGVCVMRVIPDIGSENIPNAYIVEGREGVEIKPTLLNADRSWSRTETHNRWIVTGDNPDEGAAYRGVATDSDLNSPTHYTGSYGPKPDFWSSSLLTSDAQCLQAASGRMAKEKGMFSVVNFGAIVNPALEPTDIVRVTRTRVDPMNPSAPVPIVDENHIVDSLTIPLDAAGTMTGATRSSHA